LTIDVAFQIKTYEDLGDSTSKFTVVKPIKVKITKLNTKSNQTDQMVRSNEEMLSLLRLGERMKTSSDVVDEETDSKCLFPEGLGAARFWLRL
jgi:hypothetical protein